MIRQIEHMCCAVLVVPIAAVCALYASPDGMHYTVPLTAITLPSLHTLLLPVRREQRRRNNLNNLILIIQSHATNLGTRAGQPRPSAC